MASLHRKKSSLSSDSLQSPTKRLIQTSVGIRDASKSLQRVLLKCEKIENVLIVHKIFDPSLVAITKKVADFLMHGAYKLNVYIDKSVKDEPAFANNSGQLRFWDEEFCRKHYDLIDLIITLGGDGTVLFTAWLFQNIVPPLLPFHLGSLGFLTNFNLHSFEDIITKLIEEGMRINLRMRMECSVFCYNKEKMRVFDGQSPASFDPDSKNAESLYELNGVFHVLNEVVIDRGPSPYMSTLEVFGDNKHLTTVQADGLVVATPTGSTAYSLAAGGPIVHPQVPAVLLTPICPHTLSFRPMMLPDSTDLKVVVPSSSRSTAWASFDGRHRIELKQGDFVLIRSSKYPVPTICKADQAVDWFESLTRCLKWNERQRQGALTYDSLKSSMEDIEQEDI